MNKCGIYSYSNESCAVKIYPCGPGLHSPYFPYIRNCLHRARENGFCWQHQRFAKHGTRHDATGERTS